MAPSNVTALRPSTAFTGAQLSLIRRTVAADCNEAEFDLFVSVAQLAGLDPFRKQICAVVFNKKDAAKRKMSIITTIDGFRVVAERSRAGAYRPDEDEPDYTYDETAKSALNPLGLVKARVRVWKDDKPAMGVAYWDEFAPIKDEWAEDSATGKFRKTGKQVLDTGGNWGKMPRVMLAKCAEAQALRKAFPDDLSGLYEGAELDQAVATDYSPSEIIDAHRAEERLAKIGGPGVTMQFDPAEPLESIPVGRLADRILGWSKDCGTVAKLDWFTSANTHPLREFWAHAPNDALAVKKALELRRAELATAEAQDGEVSS